MRSHHTPVVDGAWNSQWNSFNKDLSVFSFSVFQLFERDGPASAADVPALAAESDDRTGALRQWASGRARPAGGGGPSRNSRPSRTGRRMSALN